MALLEAKKLGISFGGLRAVDDFNISIEKGALYGLIGPNYYSGWQGYHRQKDYRHQPGGYCKNFPEYPTVQGSVCNR